MIAFQPMKRIAAVFDFDGTICPGDSAAPFALYLLHRRPLNLLKLPLLGGYLAGYLAGQVSKKTMKQKMLELLAGLPEQKGRELCANFWKEHLRPRLFARALERLKWHRQSGHLLILATASVDVYMEFAARELGFDHLVATATGPGWPPRITGENCWGREKVRRIERLPEYDQTDWSRSFAYSDHVSDAPLFELCGTAVAVNPHSKLLRLAGRRGWTVVNWK